MAALAPYELEREKNIEKNKRRMEQLGLLTTAKELFSSKRHRTVRTCPARHPAPKIMKIYSTRSKTTDTQQEESSLGTEEPLGYEDLLYDSDYCHGTHAPNFEALQQLRCNSQGRGSLYDSTAGITCHFCRQKKLCGEANCPRCSIRDTSKACIGKSECTKCHSATGRFCRACLLIRYGEVLEDVLRRAEEGCWLCPHCYEQEHPEEGWMCNSSICMKQRGLAPTGIAIFEAQKRGFPSVGHWLQAQVLKKGGVKQQKKYNWTPVQPFVGSQDSCCSVEGPCTPEAAEACKVTANIKGRGKENVPPLFGHTVLATSAVDSFDDAENTAQAMATEGIQRAATAPPAFWINTETGAHYTGGSAPTREPLGTCKYLPLATSRLSHAAGVQSTSSPIAPETPRRANSLGNLADMWLNEDRSVRGIQPTRENNPRLNVEQTISLSLGSNYKITPGRLNVVKSEIQSPTGATTPMGLPAAAMTKLSSPIYGRGSSLRRSQRRATSAVLPMAG